MRSTVLAASMVCSVDITRWPVSDASSAVSIVSRSRISPTRMTFGACRSAARKRQAERRRVAVQFALVNRGLLVRVQELDRILDRQDVDRARVVHRSTIAASVEDLPDPVGPVTSTMPLRRPTMVVELGRQVQFVERRNARRDDAHDDGVRGALPEDVDAEAAPCRQQTTGRPSRRVRAVAAATAIAPRSAPVQMARVWSGVSRSRPGMGDRDQFAIALDLRRSAGREDEVADRRPGGEHGGDDLLERRPDGGLMGERVGHNGTQLSRSRASHAYLFGVHACKHLRAYAGREAGSIGPRLQK